ASNPAEQSPRAGQPCGSLESAWDGRARIGRGIVGSRLGAARSFDATPRPLGRPRGLGVRANQAAARRRGGMPRSRTPPLARAPASFVPLDRVVCDIRPARLCSWGVGRHLPEVASHSVAGEPANDAPFRLIDDVDFGANVTVSAFTNLYGCRIGN